MCIEIVRYILTKGTSQEKLIAASADILDIWMRHQTGFLKWEIGIITDTGKGTDLIYWDSKESADAAAVAMKDIPIDHPWLTCYDMRSVSAEKVSVIASLPTDA